MARIPAGIILLWRHAIVDIPSGWTLCDGTDGTPDLRDRWVVGAGVTYAVDQTGGGLQHTHPFTSSVHFHDFDAGTGIAAGTDRRDRTTSAPATGTTNPGSHIPPYHALAWIMKL